jgi:tRNA-specific 2-thiouridylase
LSAERADSQEICFVPGGDYAAFVEERIGVSEKGDFVDESGKKLGVHNGIIRYTVGQRKGLGISASFRLFVTKIDPVSNLITLSLNDSYAKSITFYFIFIELNF